MRLSLALPDISLRLFTAGLAGGMVVFSLLAITLTINSHSTLERMQDLLASKMIVIEKPGFPQKIEALKDIAPVPAKEPGTADTQTQPAQKIESSIPGLSEPFAQGFLPIIRKSDGVTPFKAYARSYTKPSNLSRIALVIKDYGMKGAHSEKAMMLPADTTFLISPYAAQAASWQKKAQEKGYEIWLQIPMETGDYFKADPGPLALSRTLFLPENEARLNGALSKINGYSGVAGFYSDHFKPAAIMMQTLAGQISKRGLGYLELNPASPPSPFVQTAQSLQSPYLKTLIDLGDPKFAGSKLGDALEIAEARALDNKPVVLLASPYPRLLNDLVVWESGLAAKGITLAPLSAMAGMEE